MTNNKLIPKRRFKDFENDEAWEQRKLSDIASMKARIGWQGLKKEEFLDKGDYYLITGTDFSDGQIDLKNCHFIDQDRYNQDSNIQIKNGDVLITKDGTIGKVAFVSNLNKPATLNAGVFVVKGKNKSISNLFLYHYLAAPYLLKFSDQQATGGTIKHLNQNVLVNFPVPLPRFEEQEKIGQLLLYMDNIITLHQHKLKKLKELKLAYLSEIFPKKGEKYPNRRFAGFTRPWEQHSLNEVANYRNGKAHENNIDEEGKYVVVNSKFVSTDGRVRKLSNKQNEPLFKNEIVFVLSDVPNGRAIARTFLIEKDDKYTLNQRIAGITPLENTDPYFLYILMNRHIYFLQFDDGAKQTNLSKEDIEKFESFYPDIAEQTKIGTFFKSLDNLITLHQSKLEKFKNIKKAYLNELLV